MNFFEAYFIKIDPYIIWMFRLFDDPLTGYLTGVACLAFICTLIGKLTLYTIILFNKKQIGDGNKEMVRMHNLSLYALVSKDKKAYKLLNREANDAFGKVFFSQIAIGAATLWPAPFVLGWMQFRFIDVVFSLPFKFPLFGDGVGYVFTFIIIFIPMQFLFGKIKRIFPFFNKMEQKMMDINGGVDELVNINDFVAEPATGDK